MWNYVSVFVKVAVTGSLLGWFFVQLDLTKTFALLQTVHLGYILFVFALCVGTIGLLALRWQLLLGALHIRLPFKEVCRITFISNFFHYLFPSKLGGDAVRIFYVVKLTGRPVELILSTLVDRCVGVVALMSVPFVVILILRPTGRLYEVVGLAYALVSAFLLLAIAVGLGVGRGSLSLLSARPGTKLGSLVHSLRSFLHLYTQQKGILLQTFWIATATHVLNIAIYYSLGVSLGEGSRVLDFFYFVPMVFLATLLPVSLGGLGVREWTFVYFFTELGMPRHTALSISLLNLLVKIGASLIGAVLYLARGRSHDG